MFEIDRSLSFAVTKPLERNKKMKKIKIILATNSWETAEADKKFFYDAATQVLNLVFGEPVEAAEVEDFLLPILSPAMQTKEVNEIARECYHQILQKKPAFVVLRGDRKLVQKISKTLYQREIKCCLL